MCRLICVEMTSGARLRGRQGYTLCARACATRCLALRLRRIGDELETAWAVSSHPHGAERHTVHRSGHVWRCGVHMICAAIHVTGLVLLLTGKRHL